VAPVADADAEAVETARGGLPTGLLVSVADRLLALIPYFVQVGAEGPAAPGRGRTVEPGPKALEESEVPLRPKGGSQELTADAGVVREPHAESAQLGAFAGGEVIRSLGEQIESDIAIPDPPDETGEASESTVVGS